MTFVPRAPRIALFATACLLVPLAAPAEIVTANCTGMFDLDIYTIDTTIETQEIEKIGTATVVADEAFIVLTGDFGEYRFDLNAGTLYHNGSDTGLYCTYSRKNT